MIKIAIPLANNELCLHFGHCEEFAFVEVNEETKAIVAITKAVPPPHAPGVIPRWIASEGANVILAGGMGGMAQQILAQNGVEVVAGVGADSIENLVNSYLNGTLVCGVNGCDHGEGHTCNH